MNVIRMAAHHNGFECSKEAFIQLLLPITHKKIVSEPLHSRQFDDMSDYRVQICTVLLTPIYNATKKEYERVKKIHDSHVDRGSILDDDAYMPPWAEPHQAWLDGASLFIAIWRTNPTLSPHEVWESGVSLASDHLKEAGDLKKIIDSLVLQYQILWTCTEFVEVMRNVARVPNPKCPGNKEKALDLLCPKNDQFESRICLHFYQYVEARYRNRTRLKPTPYIYDAWQMIEKHPVGEERKEQLIPIMRKWAKKLCDSRDAQDIIKHQDPLMEKAILVRCSRLITQKEALNPPVKKPSKERQKQLSYGYHKSDIYQYIGTGELAYCERNQFRNIHQFWEQAASVVYRTFFRFGKKALLEYRKKQIKDPGPTNADKKKWFCPTTFSALMKLASYDQEIEVKRKLFFLSDAGVFSSDPVLDTDGEPKYERITIRRYRFVLTTSGDGKDYTGQEILEAFFHDQDACTDLQDEMDTNPEFVNYSTSDAYQSIQDVLGRLNELKENVHDRDFFQKHPPDSQMFIEKGTETYLLLREMGQLWLDLQHHSEHSLEQLYDMVQADKKEANCKPPKLVVTNRVTKEFMFEAPGAQWVAESRATFLHFRQLVDALHASAGNPFSDLEYTLDAFNALSEQNLFKLFMKCAGLHLPVKMGKRDEHYNASYAIWLPNWFHDSLKVYAGEVCKAALMRSAEGDITDVAMNTLRSTFPKKKAVASIKKVLNRIRKDLQKLLGAPNNIINDGGNTGDPSDDPSSEPPKSDSDEDGSQDDGDDEPVRSDSDDESVRSSNSIAY